MGDYAGTIPGLDRLATDSDLQMHCMKKRYLDVGRVTDSLNSEHIKRVASRETIYIRKIYERGHCMTPHYSGVLHISQSQTHSITKWADSDTGFWGHIRVLPFIHSFVNSKNIKTKEEILTFATAFASFIIDRSFTEEGMDDDDDGEQDINLRTHLF